MFVFYYQYGNMCEGYMFINKISSFSGEIRSNSQKQVSNKKMHSNNISFKAINFDQVKTLSDAVSKQIYGKKQIIEVYKQFPEAKGISLGRTGLPAVWLERIKDKSRFNMETFLENLGEIFTIDRHYSNIDTFKRAISNLFMFHGIISKDDKLDVKYLEKGFFGRAFHLIINDDIENSTVLKEYKRTYRYHNNHGNYSEQNVAEYISRYSGDNTNMVKYHFGDTKNGYMVVDYISKDTPDPKESVVLEDIGVAYDDNRPRNLVGKYIIDCGGFITISNLAGNKVAQDIHRQIKYAESDEIKKALFESIFSDTNSPEYENNMIGLVHSIKHLPEEDQVGLYTKMFELNQKGANIALVESIKHFPFSFKADDIINGLAGSNDMDVKTVIAREIKHFPAKLKHELFENLSKEDNDSIRKYLARNLNQYYMNISNRVNIYDNLMEGADTYANIALANALAFLSETHREERYEKLFNQGDRIVDCALARNIEIFGNDPKTMEKWVDKLMEIDDRRVKRALAESVKFMDDKLKVKAFVELLKVLDMNTKEFLAETITSIPNYHQHPEWFEELILGAGNSVKRELAKALKNVRYPEVRKAWVNELSLRGDSSVQEIMRKDGFIK